MGHIFFFSKDDSTLYGYTINGNFIGKLNTEGKINDIMISRDSKYVITGGESGIIYIYNVFSMKCIQKIPVDDPIISITMSHDELGIIVGLRNGSISIIVVEEHAQEPIY